MWLVKSPQIRIADDVSEDSYEPFLLAKELEEADEKALNITRRNRWVTRYFSCGTLWGSTFL